MLSLSSLIIEYPEVGSFRELLAVVRRRAESGERFLQFDIKPDYPDTPRNWEFQIESAFTWGEK